MVCANLSRRGGGVGTVNSLYPYLSRSGEMDDEERPAVGDVLKCDAVS